MEKIFTIKFYYRGKPEQGLVRVSEFPDHYEYAIKAHNSDLERMLFGNNTIKEKDGKLQIDLPSQNTDLARLKCAIGYALSQLLRERVIQPFAQHH